MFFRRGTRIILPTRCPLTNPIVAPNRNTPHISTIVSNLQSRRHLPVNFICEDHPKNLYYKHLRRDPLVEVEIGKKYSYGTSDCVDETHPVEAEQRSQPYPLALCISFSSMARLPLAKVWFEGCICILVKNTSTRKYSCTASDKISVVLSNPDADSPQLNATSMPKPMWVDSYLGAA